MMFKSVRGDKMCFLLFPPQSKISQVKIWNRVKPRGDEDAKL